MAVTSIRFNEEEEKLLNYLKKTYHCDASSLIKRSLKELYEDLKEKEIIEEFEKKEKNKKTVSTDLNFPEFADLFFPLFLL